MTDKVVQLRVIESRKPRRALPRTRTSEQITCRVCESETGVRTSLAVWGVQSPMRTGRQVHGGVKRLVCLYCLARGVETFLT